MPLTKIFNATIKLTTKTLATLGVSELGQITYRKHILYLLNLERIRNTHIRKLPDGFPSPSSQLIFLVYGGFDKKGFYTDGALGASCIKAVLTKNGLDINKFESILDFGCGCGRILRHWKTLTNPKIYGSDYNPSLVGWCRKSLPFTEVTQNKPQGKLDYETDKFDFIYAISVFTHLDENLQNFWIDELTRVLKPGGYLLITVHGAKRLHTADKAKYESGELVVVATEYLGTNFCNSYQSEKQVRRWLKNRLTIIDFVADGAKDAKQDQYLLQKPQ